MKIYKNDYGFSTSANSKMESGDTQKCFLSVQFKKGSEPNDSLEGDLIFKSKDGTERTCFFSSYKKKDGTIVPKLVMMGTEETRKAEPVTFTPQDIDLEGLPF